MRLHVALARPRRQIESCGSGLDAQTEGPQPLLKVVEVAQLDEDGCVSDGQIYGELVGCETVIVVARVDLLAVDPERKPVVGPGGRFLRLHR